jgi:hypothetical protein
VTWARIANVTDSGIHQEISLEQRPFPSKLRPVSQATETQLMHRAAWLYGVGGFNQGATSAPMGLI